MPANASGWFWHCLARETAQLGHLYSPGAQRGPWEWLPYALDNGCFSLWNPAVNFFDEEGWTLTGESRWRELLNWAVTNTQKPMWAIVPDRPGDWAETARKWEVYAPFLKSLGVPLAVAVQDGCETIDVLRLDPAPSVIAVGGSTDWKWATVEAWAKDFPRVHLLRCNSPQKLEYLQGLGVESCDGTGWNRGDKRQTGGLEAYCRRHALNCYRTPLTPYVCRERPVKGTGQGSLLEAARA